MTEMPVFDDTTFGKKDIFSSVVSELFREGEGGGGGMALRQLFSSFTTNPYSVHYSWLSANLDFSNKRSFLAYVS